MPTFTTPVTDGRPVGDEGDPSWAYFRHLGSWATGLTVWKDSNGVWRESIEPYAGGATYTTHDAVSGTVTSGPDEGLATAQVVYLGGHVHTITDAEAAELIAAGYGDGIGELTVDQTTADTENERWLDQIRDAGSGAPSHPSFKYLGGDVTDGVLTSGGAVLWTGADWFAGTTVDGDDTYNGPALPFRNGCLFEVTPGVFNQQIFASGGTGVWLNAETQGGLPSDTHWWPIAVFDDGGTVRVACWHVKQDATTPYGRLLDSHIVTLNVFGGYASHIVTGLGATNRFWIDGLYRDTAFTYIFGEEFNPYYETGYALADLWNSQTWKRVARVPNGDLLTVAAWEFWNGTDWSGFPAQAAPMADTFRHKIRGDAGVHKVSDGNWMLASHQLIEPFISLYTATTPTGPWTPRGSVATPILGAGKNGGVQVGQLTKFIPHLDAPVDHIQVLISRNNLRTTAAFPDQHIDTYAPLFTTVPVKEAT